MIYLASPYSHTDPAIRELRFRQVCQFAGTLIRKGLFVFSPIAHTHPIAMAGELPTHWRFWEAYDRHVLSMCSEMLVLKLEGWAESRGVAAEIRIAKEIGLPINFTSWTD